MSWICSSKRCEIFEKKKKSYLQPGPFGSSGISSLAASQIHQTDFTHLKAQSWGDSSQENMRERLLHIMTISDMWSHHGVDILGSDTSFYVVSLCWVASTQRCVCVTFSEVLSESASWRFWVKMMLKTACERLLVSFMLVAATVLSGERQSLQFVCRMLHSSGPPNLFTAPDRFRQVQVNQTSVCLKNAQFRALVNQDTTVIEVWVRPTWLCCQSPSDPGCHCRRWQPTWTGPPRRDPSADALAPAGCLCSWGWGGHAHARSRFPCSSPIKRQQVSTAPQSYTHFWNLTLKTFTNICFDLYFCHFFSQVPRTKPVTVASSIVLVCAFSALSIYEVMFFWSRVENENFVQFIE